MVASWGWGWRGIIRIPQSGAVVKGPLHLQRTQTVSLHVMGWSQAPDTLPAHCLPACAGRAGMCCYSWGRPRCREVKWLDRGHSTPVSHTPMIACAQAKNSKSYADTHTVHHFLFSGKDLNVNLDKFIVCTASALNRNVFMKHPQIACSSFLLWIIPVFQYGYTLKSTSPQVSPFLFHSWLNLSECQEQLRKANRPQSKPISFSLLDFLMFFFNVQPVGGWMHTESSTYHQ